MTAYRELIERLESATGPDRMIDQDVYCDLGLASIGPDGIVNAFAAPDYTTSIDAALSLVEKMLPDVFWGCDKWGGFYRAHITSPVMSRVVKDAPTPSLAVLACLLRALEAQSKDKEEGE